MPGVGFALGMERLTLLLRMKEGRPPAGPALYLAWFGEPARDWVFPAAHRLRRRGVSVEMEADVRSLKRQMRRADKLGAAAVLIVGEDELSRGVGLLRDIGSKRQQEIALEKVEEAVLSR